MQRAKNNRIKKIALISIGGLIAFGLTGVALEAGSLTEDSQSPDKVTTFKENIDNLFLHAEPAKILENAQTLLNNQPVDCETVLEQDENTMMLNNIANSEDIDDEDYLVVGCGGFL